jgi:hypothetical protein
MMRLYHISFEVCHRDDFIQKEVQSVRSYIVAECPYQALFFVRSRLTNTPWVSKSGSEVWEILDTQAIDTQVHQLDDVLDAVELGLVVVNIESEEHHGGLALTA